jgi:hypothetical protein
MLPIRNLVQPIPRAILWIRQRVGRIPRASRPIGRSILTMRKWIGSNAAIDVWIRRPVL